MGKRGPKAKQAKREANGRQSRKPEDVAERHLKSLGNLEEEEREMLRPGVAARIRQGVSPEASRDQMAGSFIGRLRLTGELTQPQYEAAQTYIEECRNHLIACAAPRQPGAVDLNATHGAAVALENVAFTLQAMARYRDARRAIQGAQNAIRGAGVLFAALSLCVLDDKPAINLLGDLRMALNVLARHYKLDREKGREAA